MRTPIEFLARLMETSGRTIFGWGMRLNRRANPTPKPYWMMTSAELAAELDR